MSEGKHNTINSKFWKSGYVESLSIEETLLYLFCITSPESNIAGVYTERLSFISLYTKIPQDKLLKIFKKFEKDGKIMYRDNWIVIAKRIEFNKKENTSIESGVKKILDKVPSFALDFIKNSSKAQSVVSGVSECKTLNTNIDSNINTNTDTNKSRVKKEKKDSRVKVLVDYFFIKHLEIHKRKVHIKGKEDPMKIKRLLKTFTEDEIKEKIDLFMVFDNQWVKDAGYSIGVFVSQINKLKPKKPMSF